MNHAQHCKAGMVKRNLTHHHTLVASAARLLRRTGRHIATAGVLFAAGLINACSSDAPPPKFQPVEVRVIIAEPKAAANVVEFPGRVQAVRTAEVRARVNGIVERRLYAEGNDVVENQPLFQIDPRELRANLNAVDATLARADATVANADQDVNRYKGLVAENAISQQVFDAAVARLRTARADVAQVQAQRESARLSLSFATVTAPIGGRAGRAQVTEGALVSASAATLMTTIEQLDPVYVNFSQSSSELLKTRQDITSGSLKVPELRRVTVSLVLEDGSRYAHEGHLDFLNMAIDPATGTVAIRAEFPNPEQSLLPGQFVRAHLEAGFRPDALLIPQRAVQISPKGANLMLVGPDNKVEARDVTVGDLYDGAWLITSGLNAGERVIVDGLQKVKAGQTVTVADSNNGQTGTAGPSQ